LSRIYLSLKLFYCCCKICRQSRDENFFNSKYLVFREFSILVILFLKKLYYIRSRDKLFWTICLIEICYFSSYSKIKIEFSQSICSCWNCWDQFQLLYLKIFFSLASKSFFLLNFDFDFDLSTVILQYWRYIYDRTNKIVELFWEFWKITYWHLFVFRSDRSLCSWHNICSRVLLCTAILLCVAVISSIAIILCISIILYISRFIFSDFIRYLDFLLNSTEFSARFDCLI